MKEPAQLPIGGDSSCYMFLYRKFLKDPDSVPIDWRLYFDSLEQAPDGPVPRQASQRSAAPAASTDRSLLATSLNALKLVHAYRRRGHLVARINPLESADGRREPDLDPATYDLPDDPNLPIDLQGELGFGATNLGALVAKLRAIYCGPLAVEFDHIHDSALRNWLQTEVETACDPEPAESQTKILRALTAAEEFERFVRERFPGKKIFGLSGAEAIIPFLETLVEAAASAGIEHIITGGMHRGRFNMLANVIKKPAEAIFAELLDRLPSDDIEDVSGDVSYHLGDSGTRSIAGRDIRLSLLPHPSHLISVAPAALGRARAMQTVRGDSDRTRILSVLLHTDAAFAGQGLTSELFQLSRLSGYTTGGTIHFVADNQLGFTTDSACGRSSRYCSDIAKSVECPILHVNGDAPEAVLRAARLALRCRLLFKRDVIVHLLCYRRLGHNELDEPRFTQPLMYRKIDAVAPVRDQYAKELIARGTLSAQAIEAFATAYRESLAAAFASARCHKPNTPLWLTGFWSQIQPANESGLLARVETGVDPAQLRKIGDAITQCPAHLRLHRKILAFQKARRDRIEAGDGINWATAEALAFGSLLLEGIPVRLSGQDCVRGTFTQRHLVFHDQVSGETFTPLNAIAAEQARIEAINSPLTEYAVLGFEYGYSLTDPRALVLWEAQFGDFANGAQIVIDQFIATSEAKWLRMSGLVLLLPHGQEGGGPEHSSARPERFLQLCARANMQVVNCSTPANYFHVLRRQIRAPFRKPLIIMTPKLLLRHRAAVSRLAEMGLGTAFLPVLADTGRRSEAKPRRVVICSGKVFYELQSARSEQRIEDVALLRLEQYYPFPSAALEAELARYPEAEIVWCQEEPENYGPWPFVERRLVALLGTLDVRAKSVRYVGRAAQAAPAGGSIAGHEQEQQRIATNALAT